MQCSRGSIREHQQLFLENQPVFSSKKDFLVVTSYRIRAQTVIGHIDQKLSFFATHHYSWLSLADWDRQPSLACWGCKTQAFWCKFLLHYELKGIWTIELNLHVYLFTYKPVWILFFCRGCGGGTGFCHVNTSHNIYLKVAYRNKNTDRSRWCSLYGKI